MSRADMESVSSVRQSMSVAAAIGHDAELFVRKAADVVQPDRHAHAEVVECVGIARDVAQLFGAVI